MDPALCGAMMTDTSTHNEKDRLVHECQGLVRHLAQQVRTRMPAWIEPDDLISYGQVGLMQAARDFDPEKGTKFSTFAYYRIRGAIFDGVNKLMWFRADRDPETKYNQLADSLLQTTMSDGPSGAAAAVDELTREASWFSRVTGSLAIVYLAASDEEGRTADVIDQSAEAPWTGIVEQETSRQLSDAMERLPADAAALIRAVYYEDRTLQEAADRLGISKSWASRMHARALEQLARHMKAIDHDRAPG
jgi:RNA polymerase sigma factor FliA